LNIQYLIEIASASLHNDLLEIFLTVASEGRDSYFVLRNTSDEQQATSDDF